MRRQQRAMVRTSKRLAYGLLALVFARLPSDALRAHSAVPQSPAFEMHPALSFAVIRVHASPPSEADDWGIGIHGRNFWAMHVTLLELIEWAYSINAQQIEHAPDWVATERFDVDGQPDDGSSVAAEQYRSMLGAALMERFNLRFHQSARVLPVYDLSVAEGGVKVLPSRDQAAKGSWGVHRGWLSITNMTFASVANVLQRTVFDRPVLDKTGLQDRYSFLLRWRADETQFGQMQDMNVQQEQGTDDLEDMYTSARRQLGIRIEAKRERAPTMVIDTVSKPSGN